MEYFEIMEEPRFKTLEIGMDVVQHLCEELYGSECSAMWRLLTECQSVETVKIRFNELMTILNFAVDDDSGEVAHFKEWVLSKQMHRMTLLVIDQINRGELAVPRMPRTGISAAVRADVLSAGKCAFCGSSEDLHVDHIIPLAKGGNNSRANLQCLCQSCNSQKGAKAEAEIICQLRHELFELSGPNN